MADQKKSGFRNKVSSSQESGGNVSSIFVSSNGREIKAIHINLWDLRGRRFFDIGFLLNSGEPIDLYFPFVIESGELHDLFPLLTDQVLYAIFNEKLNIGNNGGSGSKTITRQDKNSNTFELCRVTTSLRQNVPCNDFTKVTLTPINPPAGAIYIRVRLTCDHIGGRFIRVHKYNDILTNPSNEVITYIDLRINELRAAPQKVLDEVKTFPVVDCLHVFIVKSIDETLVLDSPNYMRSRFLEDDSWHTYIEDSDNRYRNFIAYHWRAGSDQSSRNGKTVAIEPGKHYGLLCGFSYKRANIGRIIFYIFFIIAFGALGNWVSDLVENRLSTKDKMSGSHTAFSKALGMPIDKSANSSATQLESSPKSAVH